MHITGIICEYNPLHAGHKKQMDTVRGIHGADTGIVCLMSGNFVQRGYPAIFDKTVRAKAALESGADLVLELPVTYALQSAEGFASGGVRILSPICDDLCFGAETADAEALMDTAHALLGSDIWDVLAQKLHEGMSFPAARQAALDALCSKGSLVTRPNDILAVEYCKAILSQKSPMQPLPILREGSYHDTAADPENPSATSLRNLIERKQDWALYTPAAEIFSNSTVHTLRAGEKAILGRLRVMTDDEFEAVPFGSEGLWRKLMHASRKEASLEAIAESVKSKRYTRSRIDRMILCAFLGLSRQDLASAAPYARVLALNDRGRQILKKARQSQWLPNIGEKVDHPWQTIEDRCDALYGLFTETPEPPCPKYRMAAEK